MVDAALKKETEFPVDKYRIVFLNNKDYESLSGAIADSKKENYDALHEKGYRSFKLKDGNVVFVPESYRELLTMKAKKNERL